jgi:hypothetical protein
VANYGPPGQQQGQQGQQPPGQGYVSFEHVTSCDAQLPSTPQNVSSSDPSFAQPGKQNYQAYPGGAQVSVALLLFACRASIPFPFPSNQPHLYQKNTF